MKEDQRALIKENSECLKKLQLLLAEKKRVTGLLTHINQHVELIAELQSQLNAMVEQESTLRNRIDEIKKTFEAVNNENRKKVDGWSI